MKNLVASLLTLASALSLSATQVTVQELTTDPYHIVQIDVPGFYTGGAYAGTIKLLVNGSPVDGFCIDPFHFSSASPLLYDVIDLADAPKPPGPMGDARAWQIEKLWELYYQPGMSADAAAGLQIAIWETVGDMQGRSFSILGNDYGASGMITAASTYAGPGASLEALSGTGQDYVIQRTPDSSPTGLLLGLGLVAVATIGSQFRSAQGERS